MDKNTIICHPQILLEQLAAPRIDHDFAKIWTELPRLIQDRTLWLAANWCVSRVCDELDYGLSFPSLEQPGIDEWTLLACEALSFQVFRLDDSFLLTPKQRAEVVEAWVKPKGHFHPLDPTNPEFEGVFRLCAFLESKKRRVLS